MTEGLFWRLRVSNKKVAAFQVGLNGLLHMNFEDTPGASSLLSKR